MLTQSKSYNTLPKNVILPYYLLNAIKQGYIRQITLSNHLGISKRVVNYHIKKLQSQHYLYTDKNLQITQSGYNFLIRIEGKLTNPRIRLENVRIKYPLITRPKAFPGKEIRLKNWSKYIYRIDRATLLFNTDSIEVIPSPVEGNHPYELFYAVRSACDNIILDYSDRLKMQVGIGELSSRMEFAIYDPVARAFTKHVGQLTVENLGKINASPPKHVGELEFFDIRSAANYLEMPNKMQRIESLLKQVVTLLTPQGENSTVKGEFYK